MEEGRLAYRVRTADASDATALRDAISSTLAHPDQQGRRESYRGAAGRGDILILERFDRPAQHWQIAGFIECHMRVDDNLSIHDVGTTGDQPQTGVVRYLLDQAFNSFRPVESQVKIRRDASTWLEIFRNIPGFHLEGEEYRRPHYWTIWRWDRQQAREDEQAQQRPAPGQRQGPRPPAPPRSNGPVQQGGPRPAGADGTPRRGPLPSGPDRPGGAPPRGPRPGDAGGPAAPGGRPTWPGGGGPLGSRPGGPRPGGPRPGGPRPGGPRPGGFGPGGPNRSGRPSRPRNPR